MRFPPVPAGEREGLKALARLDDEHVALLLTLLEAAPLNVNRDQFAAGVEALDGVDREQQLAAVSALLFLHAVFSGSDVPSNTFVGDVCESLAASKVELDAVERLRTILPAFMECEGLRLQAKAVDLQVDHARTFQSVKVISELRPVFDMGAAERIVGALIFHTLKINYFGLEGPREVFIALDDGDLAQIKRAIVKADVKGRVLRETIAKLGISDFGTAPREGER